MAATPIGRVLRFAAWVLAAALLTAGAGSLTTAARADETPPCDEAAQDAPATEGEAPPCAELVPPAATTTTTPAAEPTRATATIPDAVPPKVVEGLTPEAPAEAPKPAPAKPPATEPEPATTPTWNGGAGIFDGATRITLPPHSGTPRLAGGPYVFPVVGESSFTDTWGAARATVAWHHGVDIFAPFGAPIVAVADGTLFSVGWNTIGGRRLWLRDRQGNYFYYAHLSAFAAGATNGTVVRAGTVVGYVGDTGDAEGTPYHLHFEIHPVSLLSLGYDGAVNPFPYVSAWPQLGESFAARGGSLIAPAAPTPGAILMGFTDISSADGLAPESLDQTLGEPALAAALDAQPEAVIGATLLRTPIVAPREDGERIARTLDSEASRPARYADSVWDALAECESGGDWSTNTGNGFMGGLQFLPSTWLSHGGNTFARSPNLATREEQIAVARRVLETQGWQAWPACSAMLGLRKLER